MMAAFGKFLEVSLPAPDVLQSLAFYRALGFVELTTGDIRRWHYAVVSDGGIAIGLHGGGIHEPTLSFVRPNLARQVGALRDAGHLFEDSRLGPEEFHEARLRTPDGQAILMVEARTFSPGSYDARASLIGQCVEVSLACAEVDASRQFFEQAGFLAGEAAGDDGVGLTVPGVTLGLRSGTARPVATLRFRAADPRRVLQDLAALDLAVRREAEGTLLTAPEGTRLLLLP